MLLSKLSSLLYTPSPRKEKRRQRLPPNEVMKQRWERIISESVPYVDQSDVFQLAGPSRQFAPEYSQIVYQNMLRQEKAIGNYFDIESCSLGFPVKARETMV